MDDLNQAVEYIHKLVEKVSKEGARNKWYGNKIEIPLPKDVFDNTLVIEVSILKRSTLNG